MPTTAERVSALAQSLVTREQCDKGLRGAVLYLDESVGLSNKGGFAARMVGLTAQIKDSIRLLRKYVVKLQAALPSSDEGVTDAYRKQVATAMVQALDLLKRVDAAVNDPEIHFYPDFSAFVRDIAALAAQAAKAVVSALPIAVPIAIGAVGLGFLALKARR